MDYQSTPNQTYTLWRSGERRSSERQEAHRKILEGKQGKMITKQKERKEGRKEGKKEGRKEGRNKGREEVGRKAEKLFLLLFLKEVGKE